MKIGQRRIPADVLCVVLLVALWWLFFWRLFTPNTANQLSLKEGDFSGQFVAWAGYQAEQLAQGRIPLWNPFNNSGHPFLADTQAAAFYPPRLIILALTNLGGKPTPGVLYSALQIEMAVHVLIASLLMYTLVRRMSDSRYRYMGGIVAGLTFAYGGYMTGYPILEPATLGAVIWIPLAILGMHEATRHTRMNWLWLGASGVALGLSLHSGYPQLTLWSIYITVAYLAYRVYMQRRSWRVLVIGTVLFGALGGGLAAIQLLPGLQYYAQSARHANFTFESQGNGFPLYDMAQMLFPGFITLWSPLYFGIVGTALALLAVWRRVGSAWFWAGVMLIALGLSFGHNTLIYDIFYNLIPGFSLFRQQERSAFTISVAASILTGLGAISLFDHFQLPVRYQQVIRVGLAIMAAAVAIFFIGWQITNTGNTRLNFMAFSLFIGALTVGLFASPPNPLSVNGEGKSSWRPAALVFLIVIDLFTIGHSIDNYDTHPVMARLPTPPLVKAVQADSDGVYRVDGSRGLLENYGSFYDVMDIRGISPLRIDRYERLLGIPLQRIWELLAVRYVFTDNRELPVPSSIVASGEDPLGKINLHKLADPRPFVRLVYRTWIEPDDTAALNALADPNIDVRRTAILPADPQANLPDQAPADAQARLLNYAPESFTIQTTSATPAILDVSQVNYPNWTATIDGSSVTVLRANVALMAVVVPAGTHTVQFTYRSPLYEIGALITFVTMIGGLLIGIVIWRRRIDYGDSEPR